MASLQETWKVLYTKTLPELARSRSPAQKHWPVFRDHCFARIIYDAVLGRGEYPDKGPKPESSKRAFKPAPWTDRVKSPAIKHMSEAELRACIALGEAIAQGSVDLVHLDEVSLHFRNKAPKSHASNAKRAAEQKDDELAGKRLKASPSKTFKNSSASNAVTKEQNGMLTSFGFRAPDSPHSQGPAPIDADLSSIIENADITAFRKQVLSALCQIPRGQVSTYLALSDFLDSSPRAVGNALRRNPFAPRVPCHRIIAADSGIGGFGGSWGIDGKHYGEKVRLLREEGVRMDEKNGKVKGAIWKGFA